LPEPSAPGLGVLPRPAHQFDDLAQQHEAASLGMWVFIATELLFFGGLFVTYAIYRTWYPESFAAASHELDLVLGAINTSVLLISSLTMALAVHGAQIGSRRSQVAFLLVTILLGLTFLGIKGVEYYQKIVEGHVPGAGFHMDLGQGQADAAQTGHAEIFFSLYFVMTGLHALHMVVGVGVLLVMVYWARQGKFVPQYYSPLETSGLYWHFVDIIWIFLFPLLYLIGRHGPR
jgi:cytochrome c oxidase subunit 3